MFSYHHSSIGRYQMSITSGCIVLECLVLNFSFLSSLLEFHKHSQIYEINLDGFSTEFPTISEMVLNTLLPFSPPMWDEVLSILNYKIKMFITVEKNVNALHPTHSKIQSEFYSLHKNKQVQPPCQCKILIFIFNKYWRTFVCFI